MSVSSVAEQGRSVTHQRNGVLDIVDPKNAFPKDPFEGAKDQLTLLHRTSSDILSGLKENPTQFLSGAGNVFAGGMLLTDAALSMSGLALFILGGVALYKSSSNAQDKSIEAPEVLLKEHASASIRVLGALSSDTKRHLDVCQNSIDNICKRMDDLKAHAEKIVTSFKGNSELNQETLTQLEIVGGTADCLTARWAYLWESRESSDKKLNSAKEKLEGFFQKEIQKKDSAEGFQELVEISKGVLDLLVEIQESRRVEDELLEEIQEKERSLNDWQNEVYRCICRIYQNVGSACDDANRALHAMRRNEEWQKKILAKLKRDMSKYNQIGYTLDFSKIHCTLGACLLLSALMVSPYLTGVSLVSAASVPFKEQILSTATWIPWFQANKSAQYETELFKVSFDPTPSSLTGLFQGESSQEKGVVQLKYNEKISLRFHLKAVSLGISPFLPDDLSAFSEFLQNELVEKRLIPRDVYQIIYELSQLSLGSNSTPLLGDGLIYFLPLKLFIEDHENDFESNVSALAIREPIGTIEWSYFSPTNEAKINLGAQLISLKCEPSHAIRLIFELSKAIRLGHVSRENVDSFLKNFSQINVERWKYLLPFEKLKTFDVELDWKKGDQEGENVKEGVIYSKGDLHWQVQFNQTEDVLRKFILGPLVTFLNSVQRTFGKEGLEFDRKSMSRGFLIVKFGDEAGDLFPFNINEEIPFSWENIKTLVDYLKEKNVPLDAVFELENWLFSSQFSRRNLKDPLPIIPDGAGRVFFDWLRNEHFPKMDGKI